MPIDAQTLKTTMDRAALAAQKAEQDLNEADGKIGDGDTGVMLRRLSERLATAAPADEQDVGAFFQALGKASASGTGSSLGTLVTVSMLALAKETRGRTELPWSELGGLLQMVCATMMNRGGAALGDKTVVDSLDAVARAIAGLDEPSVIAQAARKAADQTLDVYRDKPNKIGRARMFSERSIGIDDPGMLAFKVLLDGISQNAAA
ncbi:dihydroxyacetone kinase subunit L [Bosea sp. PAMC 26642]|uniref:dihydroxyacetone kinase subunit L n=1 Tax=Bosea sp. (strain PAMC 26642) TaxID=1792307 RepID=UPI0007706CE3|nr:dihydroxyacetone kinase subunit L [Bosea sp. PAMC 26642]AMJ61551.1 Dak phosphatase [Bosea sp. PAMC 26642]